MVSYVVILDAGSGGTRPYIYAIQIGSVFQNANVTELLRRDGTPIPGQDGGIHELGDPAEVAEYLDPIFANVDRILPPGIQRSVVQLFLLATGGVRDLPQDAQLIVLGLLTAYTDTLGFAEVECEAITGTDEAKYGWVAANYSQGHVPPYEDGYVEMGGASVQIAFPLPANGSYYKVAMMVVEEFIADKRNTAELVQVGPRNVFLASYRLGSRLAYKEYKRVLFESTRPEIINVANGNIVYYDPSKRQGYEKLEDGRIVRGIERVEGGVRVRGQPRPLALLHPMLDAVLDRLHPLALATTPLDKIVRELNFIGGGNFWWGTRPLGQTETDATSSDFSFPTYFKRLMESSKIPHSEFYKKTGREGPMRANLDNSIFTGKWIERVLAHAFGMILTKVTFTPYNGNGNRFSWTLGKAVLLAAPNLEHL